MSKLAYLSIALVAICIAAPFAAFAQPKALPNRQNNEGGITVSVTPTDLSGSDNWQFSMQFTSHSVPITQDIAAVSTLSGGNASDERAIAWQGDAPGGHHRKGVLLFKPINPLPQTITLKVRQIGSAAERVFTWTLTGR